MKHCIKKGLAVFLLVITGSPLFANDTLVNFATSAAMPGSVWKYLDDGSNQGTAWQAPGFNDAAWASGVSELGYGDGDENTVLNAGCTPVASCGTKFITTYFRRQITIANPLAYTNFKLSVKRDDGIVVYVNGVQVFIDNLSTGAAYDAPAAGAGDDGEAVLTTILPPAVFSAGVNTLAVEIHQSGPGSSDISFDMELVALTAATLTRGPYLQAGKQDSLTIRWRTDVPTDTKVGWGTVQGIYPNSLTNTLLTTEHIMRIGGLAADTKYFYTIGGSTFTLQSGADNRFTTLPPANTSRKLRFLALGDCGNNSTNQVNVKNTFINFMGGNEVDAMILLGDNAYSVGSDAEYQTNFFDVYRDDLLKYYKLYPAPGNHDYGNSPSNTGSRTMPYHLNFTVPMAGEIGGVPSGVSNYYSFNAGDVHFVSLDSYGMDDGNSTKLYDTLGAQCNWLKSDLAANTKRWTVVYFHHPPYTKTSHTSDGESDLVAMRENFIRILERFGVDLVLCGHSHGYERSYLLKGFYNSFAAPLHDADFNAAVHTATGSTQNALYDGTAGSCAYSYLSGQYNHGTVYTVSGSAGQVGGTSAGYPQDCMHYSNATNGGCFYFEVDSNRLDAKFISYATAPTPLIRDQFTIFKDVNKVSGITVLQHAAVTLTASWRGSYFWPGSGATTRSISPSTAIIGTFGYIVRDAAGCIKDSFSVTVTTPLPVSITRFTATAKAKKIELAWATSQETNSNYFTVEKSTDGILFSLLGRVPAAGSSTMQREYLLTDSAPADGSNYYRLSQTDKDGHTNYFNIQKVFFKYTSSITATALPVAAGKAQLMINSIKKQAASLTVLDMSSRRVLAQSLQLNSGANTTHLQLPAGMYAAKIITSGGESAVVRLVVR